MSPVISAVRSEKLVYAKGGQYENKMVDEMTQSERSRVVVVRFVLRSVAPRVDENFN